MKKMLGLATLMLSLAVPSALAAETLEVKLGNSQVIGPLERMATVIVGDNDVADATLGGGGTIILTGQTLGATNLIVLDEAGRELLSSDLQVVPVDNRPTTRVRISRGVEKPETYVCGTGTGCTPAAGAMASVASPEQESVEDPGATTPQTAPESTPETAPGTDAPVSEELVSRTMN